MCIEHNVVCRCYDDKHAIGLRWRQHYIDLVMTARFNVIGPFYLLTINSPVCDVERSTRFIDRHIIIMPRRSTEAWITNYDSMKNKLSYR